MMISPEVYYEQYLKGKSEKEIIKVIRGLKREIGHKKNILENPDNILDNLMFPSESTRIYWTREYLNKAKEALVESGGSYKLSRSEIKGEKFNNNIPFISKVIFEIGGYFEGYYKYIVTFNENNILITVEHFGNNIKNTQLLTADGEIFIKDDFLNIIKDLNIGEWLSDYSTERFGYSVCDGTQWSLLIEYANGEKPFRSGGSNAYPYNFEEFQEFFQ